MVRWMKGGPMVAGAATEAALWLLRAGELDRAAGTLILNMLRGEAPSAWSPAAVSIIGTLGDEYDRGLIVPLLGSRLGAVRIAAGEALLWDAEYTEAILEAASSDPDLFEIACRAVLVAEPTEENVRRLLSLPKPSMEIARPTLLRTANGLAATDLLAVSRAADDLGLRRGLLMLLTDSTRVMSEGSDPARLAAIANGVAELYEIELADRQPEAALAVIDGADFAIEVLGAERVAGLRATALVALGHIEVAAGLEAPCAAWLRGLEVAVESDVGPRIVESIEERFTSSMIAEERQRFEALKAAVDAADKARRAKQPVRSG